MITALVSKKGGVGKTTSSVNLAAAVALSGRKVLAVDLDPNAGLSLSLGLARGDFGPGSGGLLLRQTPARQAVRKTSLPGLDVIPASVDLRSAEGDLARLRGKELVLRRALQSVRQEYDHIFLDCPSSLGLLSQNAVAAADGFLVPAAPHFLAIEGLEHLVETVDRLRLRCGTETRFLGIVLTMVDYRLRMTRQNVAAMRERFGHKVLAIEVRTNVRLAEAPAYGKTIFEHDPRAVGAQAYRLLASELLMIYERQIRFAPPKENLDLSYRFDAELRRTAIPA